MATDEKEKQLRELSEEELKEVTGGAGKVVGTGLGLGAAEMVALIGIC